jgi:hypothetical protein
VSPRSAKARHECFPASASVPTDTARAPGLDEQQERESRDRARLLSRDGGRRMIEPASDEGAISLRPRRALPLVVCGACFAFVPASLLAEALARGMPYVVQSSDAINAGAGRRSPREAGAAVTGVGVWPLPAKASRD